MRPVQMTYRATRRLQPSKDEILVRSPEQARRLIKKLERAVKFDHLTRLMKANYLCVIATLYEALGDPKMLESAQRAYDYEKGWSSASLLAVALHHFGRIQESLQFYKEAYSYPHEPGLEVDIGYSGALLFEGKWLEAWPIIKSLKKRMVYALYLPFWDGQPTKKISVVSEGGFGDLIQNSRYLPMVAEKCEEVTVYLPPYFFEHGFSDLVANQPWFPKVKPMLELPEGVPAAGFFDLPAIFETTPDTIPSYPNVWEASKPAWLPKTGKPLLGLCWASRSMETPLVAESVYRSLSFADAERLVEETKSAVDWVSLQHNAPQVPKGVFAPKIESWLDTASIIEQLTGVVSVDTAVAHLAAVMQKPTWVMLSGAVDWKWGLRDFTNPWYPTICSIRNNGFGFQNTLQKTIDSLNRGFFEEHRKMQSESAGKTPYGVN